MHCTQALAFNETKTAWGGGSDFCTTRWSLVVLASGHDGDAEQALRELCESYWLPLYAFVRRSGKSVEESQDLTQEFLRRMLESGNLVRADRDQGKFRTYLLGCLKNLLVDEWRKSTRQKRGGGVHTFSLDDRDAEAAYQRELHDDLTP